MIANKVVPVVAGEKVLMSVEGGFCLKEAPCDGIQVSSDKVSIFVPDELWSAGSLHCLIDGEPCEQHAGMVHGREAEELRQSIEKVLKDFYDDDEMDIDAVLRSTLDRIDARDSLAYVEKQLARIKELEAITQTLESTMELSRKRVIELEGMIRSLVIPLESMADAARPFEVTLKARELLKSVP